MNFLTIFKAKKLRFFHVEQKEKSSPLAWLKRQALGLVSLIVGVILSIPGVPGPGFVFFILALLLIAFPKKRALIFSLKQKKWFRVARVIARKHMNILLVLPKRWEPN